MRNFEKKKTYDKLNKKNTMKKKSKSHHIKSFLCTISQFVCMSITLVFS